MQHLILITLISYYIVILAISFYTARNATNHSFFLGNRKSPWFVVAFGMISASLSGVTFISVPGWVKESSFSYMQILLGYLVGYFIVAKVLMPMYYKLNLTSIYSYLKTRFGEYSYKTGSVFFLISRTIGTAFRIFLGAKVLQFTIFDSLGVSFEVNVLITVLVIWLYTYKGGIKTLIWVDFLQSSLLLISTVFILIYLSKYLGFSFNDMVNAISESKYSQVFFFNDWSDKKHFIKHFLSGIFIVIAMTGLDQDMMQKNLSCKNIKDAQKNMYWFSVILIPVNLLFLCIGVLLVLFAQKSGMAIPAYGDDFLPLVVVSGFLPFAVVVFFALGLITTTYSSSASALTALTTSFTLDILNAENKEDKKLSRIKNYVHVGISLFIVLLIFIFKIINDQSVISAIFTVAGYTYGPLLGLYAFGLFTSYQVKDKFVPFIALSSPLLCFGFDKLIFYWTQSYRFGFELLILNGLITFLGLYFIKKQN